MRRDRGSSLLLLLAQRLHKTARNRRKYHHGIGDLPQFEFDAAPRGERCEKCGMGADGDLRFVIFRGRTRYVGRTLCDHCTEEVLEAMVASDPDAES